jgi:hypothetical protein
LGTNCGRYALSQLAVIDEEFNEKRNNVADLMIQGNSEYAVARQLHMKVVEVKNYWNQWKDLLASDDDGRDVAKDHLNRMVKHYDLLIEKSHANLKDLHGLVFDEKISAQVNSTLKNIADFEAKRVDALQKAGLLDGSALGDELAEREEREAILIDILKNDLCDDCRPPIMTKIRKLTGKTEPHRDDDITVEVVNG